MPIEIDTAELSRRAERLRDLHHGAEPLVLLNVWDVVGARIVAEAGFPAVATTSAGVAFAQGYPDGQYIDRDQMLAVVARIAAAISLPLTADLEAGYGDAPEAVAATVAGAIAAGAVGINLEDGTGDRHIPLIERDRAVARIAAARAAADATGVRMVINARTDAYLSGGDRVEDPFAVSVERANAFRAAGADCLFVPGVRDPEIIARLVAAVGGPLNVLAGPGSPSVAELGALGVSRISVGGSLSRAAVALVRDAAQELQRTGTYNFAASAMSHGELNALLAPKR